MKIIKSSYLTTLAQSCITTNTNSTARCGHKEKRVLFRLYNIIPWALYPHLECNILLLWFQLQLQLALLTFDTWTNLLVRNSTDSFPIYSKRNLININFLSNDKGVLECAPEMLSHRLLPNAKEVQSSLDTQLIIENFFSLGNRNACCIQWYGTFDSLILLCWHASSNSKTSSLVLRFWRPRCSVYLYRGWKYASRCW